MNDQLRSELEKKSAKLSANSKKLHPRPSEIAKQPSSQAKNKDLKLGLRLGWWKALVFRDTVETKTASFMILGFNKCQDQIQKLQGFVEEEASPSEDEFAILLKEDDQGANPDQE
ncbi:UNVERIFIED_CONTAM: hypothetical protein Sindi_2581400 [Sesamum indicum]